MKTGFIIIGAHKAGSTSLAWYLSQHPDICFCKIKEPHFFTQTNPLIKTEEDYFALFNPKPGQLLGEASINCTMPKRVAGTEERIYRHNPDMKLVYLLRDPVERIASAYRYRFMNGWLKSPLQEMQKEILEDDYVPISSYYSQLESYLNFFPKNSIHLCLNEDMKKDPVLFMKQLLQFLELPWFEAYDDPAFYEVKKSSAKEKGLNKTGRMIASTGITRFIPMWLKVWGKSLFPNKLSDVPPLSKAFTYQLKAMLRPQAELLKKHFHLDLSSWDL